MTGSSRPGPPPLRPFGLVLRHDGTWIHEGVAFSNPKLRAVFDRSVRFLPEEGKYVVVIGRFRGEIELQEAGFFVREFDAESGEIRLSDGSAELLEVGSLCVSPHDGALLCRIKRDLVPAGLPARFTHAAQAELLNAVEDDEDSPGLRVAGARHPIPDL